MERRHEEMEAVRKLREAAVRGSVSCLTELLDEYPLLLQRIIIDDCDTETPLHIAVMFGHVHFVEEILNRNPELALEPDSRGCSPLHLASAKGYLDIVNMLLLKTETGLVFKLRDELGRTPLHVAAMRGRDEVVKELLRVGSESPQILTYKKETVLHVAVKHNRLDTLKLLLDHEAAQLLNSKDEDGNTILHLAVANRQTETVKYLVGGSVVGVEINAQNENGLTPLDVLHQSPTDLRIIEIADVLRDNMAIRGSVPIMTIGRKPDNNNNKNERDNWVNDMRSALMVVASLIATVTFQAGIAPAGGLWQESGTLKPDKVVTFAPGIAPAGGLWQGSTGSDHYAGTAIMADLNPSTYQLYIIFNTLSFLSSLSIILMLISGFALRRKLYMWILMVVMWIAVSSMALTYSVSVSFEIGNSWAYGTDLAITYGTKGVFALMLIVFSGNILRLLIWMLKGPVLQAKEIVIKKLSMVKKLMMKKFGSVGQRGDTGSLGASPAGRA